MVAASVRSQTVLGRMRCRNSSRCGARSSSDAKLHGLSGVTGDPEVLPATIGELRVAPSDEDVRHKAEHRVEHHLPEVHDRPHGVSKIARARDFKAKWASVVAATSTMKTLSR